DVLTNTGELDLNQGTLAGRLLNNFLVGTVGGHLRLSNGSAVTMDAIHNEDLVQVDLGSSLRAADFVNEGVRVDAGTGFGQVLISNGSEMDVGRLTNLNILDDSGKLHLASVVAGGGSSITADSIWNAGVIGADNTSSITIRHLTN